MHWLRDIERDDFFQSEYYCVFYSQIGLSDSIELLWRIDGDSALNFFIERSIRNSKSESADLIAIQFAADAARAPDFVLYDQRELVGTYGATPETTEGTIKTHRKNIHRKLDIGSQAEPFSWFINCIPFALAEGSTYPLEAYQKSPASARRRSLLEAAPLRV